MSRTCDLPPKRRLPRFSLITLLVAVNVAGVLAWANVHWRKYRREYQKDAATRVYREESYAGWPLTYAEHSREHWFGIPSGKYAWMEPRPTVPWYEEDWAVPQEPKPVEYNQLATGRNTRWQFWANVVIGVALRPERVVWQH